VIGKKELSGQTSTGKLLVWKYKVVNRRVVSRAGLYSSGQTLKTFRGEFGPPKKLQINGHFFQFQVHFFIRISKF